MAKMDDRQGKATKAPHASDPERTAKSDRRKLERVTLQSTAAGDELLYFDSVSARVGLRRTAIYERISNGTFPQPVRLSARCVRWRASDIRHWLIAQPKSYDPSSNGSSGVAA